MVSSSIDGTIYSRVNYVGHIGHIRKACSISIGTPVGKVPCEPYCRRKNNIKMDLQEIQQYAESCILLAQDRAR